VVKAPLPLRKFGVFGGAGLRLAYLAGWLSLIMTVVSAFGFV